MRGDAWGGKEGSHVNIAKEESAKVTDPLEVGGKVREKREGRREKNRDDLGSQRFVR